MQENLVIVESPAKAKTIEKFLGSDFKVMSSYGHIRDLKKRELSIDEKTMMPHYEIPEGRRNLVVELRGIQRRENRFCWPSVEAGEGEATSWNFGED